MEFHGVEMAAMFDNFRLAVQLGKATHENRDHDSLDYANRGYGIIEGEYFLANGMSVIGSFGRGEGQSHSTELTTTQIEFGVTVPVGTSGLLASASVRRTLLDETPAGEANGHYTNLLIGLTMPLGGSVRDVRSSSTPMIRTNLPGIVAAMSSVAD